MKPFLFVFSICCLHACHSTQYSADQFPEKQLTFGSGGGFSGIESTYTLLENGQFWIQNGPGAPASPLPSIARSKAEQFFIAAEEKLFGEVALNPLGNTYRFVGYQTGSRHSRITWTGERPTVDPRIAALIDDLYQLIPQK